MIELKTVFGTLSSELKPTMEKLGFAPVIPEGTAKGALPTFKRDDSEYLAYKGEKGSLRILFNDDKIRLLSGDADAKSEDDSDFSLLASFLFVLDEYELKDVKSVSNEIAENLKESYSPKQIAKRQQNIKAQATVSRSQVKSGALLYDPSTLAIRLAAMYPEIKEEYTRHMQKYDEFLCENFFVNVVNPYVYETIRENNPQRMKKLFGILNEIFDDGSNEVQDVIIVTMLASFNYEGDMLKNVISYAGDTLLEPFIRVNNVLKKSKSQQMRLENPPVYKPKKKKNKSGLMGMMSGGGLNG